MPGRSTSGWLVAVAVAIALVSAVVSMEKAPCLPCLPMLPYHPPISWIYLSACLRLQMLGEKFCDALKIELIGCAGKRVRLAGVFEVLDLFAGSLEPFEQIARPFVRNRFIGGTPVNLDRRADVLQVGKWRQSLV